MRITIKKWGNSAGMVIPGVVMKELGLNQVRVWRLR
jgi:antitoxin ChpS